MRSNCKTLRVPTLSLILCVAVTRSQSTTSIDSSYAYTKIQNEQKSLKERIRSHPDVNDDYFPNKEALDAFNRYRLEYPDPEDFVIDMLVNPCGANGTHDGLDESIAKGYDCCMYQFGRGEYGFLKYDNEREMINVEVFQKRLLAHHSEVIQNIITVDEHGVEIPYHFSRRADDHTIIDETCIDFRKPHTSCVQNRLRVIKSPYVPPCWDHNQTVDATLDCFTPNGKKSPNCMQISYAQNAFISICGGDFSDDDRCGTFIEIHRENGSPYDSESTIMADTKIVTEETNGMYTTTIDLTYKGDKNRLLCAYQETKIRIGSMVKVVQNSPQAVRQCCCPKRSFFCPMKPMAEGGPFADSVDTLEERLERDEQWDSSPHCPQMNEDEDKLFCNVEMGESGYSDSAILEAISETKRLTYTKECDAVEENEDGLYSSNVLYRKYSSPCPYGEAFKSCGASNLDCLDDDVPFSFNNRIGKVFRLPTKENKSYGVSFNDGRTIYYFAYYELHVEIPQSNYELWFVQRNRFEKILQKRKGFRVIWPLCTFDLINDRYFPFAQVSDDGKILRVLSE
jgi:hypothetical protein